MLGRISGILVATVLYYGALASGQVSLNIRARTPAPTASGNVRIDSNLVLVPVTVSDSSNRPIVGLDKDQFRVFDNKIEQTVTHFAMDDEPLAIGLVFDASGSMGSKLKRSRRAASEFFKTANPQD